MILSRRSFLKVAGLTTVAAAGASMFTGCGLTTFTPVKFVAGDPAEVTTTFINATKDLNVLLWPGDAYKNADKCKKNVATQMTTYYHIDISGIEFDTVEYKEATEEAAAHVEITVKAKTQH